MARYNLRFLLSALAGTGACHYDGTGACYYDGTGARHYDGTRACDYIGTGTTAKTNLAQQIATVAVTHRGFPR